MWLVFHHKPWKSRKTTARAGGEDEAVEEILWCKETTGP